MNALNTVNKMSKKSADLEKKLAASKDVIAGLRKELKGLNGTAKYFFSRQTKHFLLHFNEKFPVNAVANALRDMSHQEIQDYRLNFVEPYLKHHHESTSKQVPIANRDDNVQDVESELEKHPEEYPIEIDNGNTVETKPGASTHT